MAVDETLLKHVSCLGHPIIRFYGWNPSAASFGYSQRYSDVARWTSLRPLVRRPTGGGLVPHDRDWTYSLAFPPDHPWRRLRATESYRQVHEWIRDAFASLNLSSALSPRRNRLAPGQCFAGAETSDLLWQGQKIAGAAQRRNRLGLLIQGSIQPPAGSPGRTEWQVAMLKVATANWGILWTHIELNPSQHQQITELQSQKYSLQIYNEQR
jgi:lipoate-protein ligase A